MIPGGHARTHKKWIPRTGPGTGTGPGTSPETGPGTLVLLFQITCSQPKPVVLGPVPGQGPGTSPRSGVWSWDWSHGPDTGPGTGPRTSPGGSPSLIESWCIGSQFKLLCCHLKPLQTPFRTGTQDTGQGPRSPLPATKPARAVIDVLVVVEDPWIYSASESNTVKSNRARLGPACCRRPVQGNFGRASFRATPGEATAPGPTRSDLGASRPKR